MKIKMGNKLFFPRKKKIQSKMTFQLESMKPQLGSYMQASFQVPAKNLIVLPILH